MATEVGNPLTAALGVRAFCQTREGRLRLGDRCVTEMALYVAPRARSEDVLSVLGSPSPSSEHSTGQQDSTARPHAARFGHSSHTHPLSLAKSFPAAPSSTPQPY